MAYVVLMLCVLQVASEAELDVTPRPLDHIVAELAAAEEIYVDHDVELHVEMRLDRTELARFKKPAGSKKKQKIAILASSDSDSHFVSQGKMFRLDRFGKSTTVDGKTRRTLDLINSFDGEVLRRLDQNLIANISPIKTEDPERFFPHSMMLSHAQLYGPLSLLLQGDLAVQNSAYAGQLKKMQKVKFKGRTVSVERVDEFTCDKVELVFSIDQIESARIELWLARERNLIPVKMAHYTSPKPRIMTGSGEIQAWREVHEGVWSPARCLLNTYGGDETRESYREEGGYSSTTTVEKINLNPSYTRDYFSKVEVPKGAKVYVLDAAGKILETQTQKNPGLLDIPPKKL